MSTVGVVSGGGGGHVPHLRLPRPPSSLPSSSLWTRSTVDGRPPGPDGQQRPVCRFWLLGRCTRRPCPFLHSRVAPPSPVLEPRRQQPPRRSLPGSRVWRNPNLVPHTPSSGNSPSSGGDDRNKGTVMPGGGETLACQRPPTPPPPGDDGGVTPGGGETLVCQHRPTPPPPGDDGGVTPSGGVTLVCPRPTTPPSPGDDGGVTPGGEETLVFPIPLPPGDDGRDEKPSTVLLRQDTVESQPPPPPTPHLQDKDVGDDSDRPSLGDRSTFSFLTSLGVRDDTSHEKRITGIALPSGSDKIFSGSTDGTVRVWDCDSGKCVQVIKLGGPLTCIVTDGPWVFVGTHGGVNVCNTLTGTGLSLPGSSGPVYSLTTSDDMLFAGVSDGSILAWKVTLDSVSGGGGGIGFRAVTSLGGHTSAVISLVVGRSRLYSGSMDRSIRVWDVQTLQCCHTLSSAHDAAVTSLLCWTDFLLSCSLDGSIKVWGSTFSTEGEGGALGLEVVYTQHEEHGVFLLNGVCDTEERPVLMCSLGDNSVHLYDLPSFSDRGRITSSSTGEVTAMHTGPHGFFFTGDVTGELSVWRWSQK